MKTQFKFVLAFIVASGIHSVAFAVPTAEDKADASQINSACAQDAQTAGCSGEVVGKGLLKCLHSYKEANKSYKFSPGCKAAMQKLHQDKEAGK
jgi:hypothetical protein